MGDVSNRPSDRALPLAPAGRQEGALSPWAYLLLLAAVVHSLPFAFLAEQRDAGELLLTAQQLLDGQLPYTRAYITKTPGAAYVIAGFMAVAGQNLLGIRFLILAANVVS